MNAWRKSGLAGAWLGAVLVLGGGPRAFADNEPGAIEPSPAPPAPSGPQRKIPLDIRVDKSKVYMQDHHFEITATRDIVRYTVKVVGESGNVIAEDDVSFDARPPGFATVVRWSPSTDEAVARIEVFVYDPEGSYKGVALTPWSVSIAHEDVNFKTDSAQIEESEKPKLEASYAKVGDAVAKLRANHVDMHVTLYIGGHTDTVGEASYNLRLSRNRAQSIARWFRQRGLKIPIAFEGFGESSLLVRTADNVDEPRNRRVDYILSAEEPVFKTSGFRPAWNRIQ